MSARHVGIRGLVARDTPEPTTTTTWSRAIISRKSCSNVSVSINDYRNRLFAQAVAAGNLTDIASIGKDLAALNSDLVSAASPEQWATRTGGSLRSTPATQFGAATQFGPPYIPFGSGVLKLKNDPRSKESGGGLKVTPPLHDYIVADFA
jgi:hypothetical protein